MNKSDSNFLLVTGESGIGKSHFLNYILNEANDIRNTYGKAVAVKVSN
jgi:chromosomal replication initiation ATPase DnaA